MLDAGTLVAFLPAVLAIVVAPGPGTVYTMTASLRAGRTAGLAAALGTATGVLAHTAAAVLGLSALLRTSALAYALVKYVGAAYLVYVGLRTLRAEGEFEFGDIVTDDRSLPRTYRAAVAINVSNPKVAVFVLAFLPQFVPAGVNATLQLSVLGALYALVSLAYLGVVAVFAARTRHLILETPWFSRLVRYASGSVLLGFGVALAVEERPV
ncbi:LysE family translocator [Halolamina sp.]|jgi:threonine/homoserine/homoserine lactone efflux protein|uniref:LysE family translocator n=1 Tax=Halolamina sp. TaxID=1940283 RepID=UPI000223BB63|nr:Lysine exporter protein (LYSE/YGGA) [halophilic archaeon DL31]